MKLLTALVPTTLALLLSISSSHALPQQTGSIPPFCETCSPFPEQNRCDITTSCIYVWAHPGPDVGPNYCACRHGYRATGYEPWDASVQFRLPWPTQEGRVFVRPGVVCDTLCAGQSCDEVFEQSTCL